MQAIQTSIILLCIVGYAHAAAEERAANSTRQAVDVSGLQAFPVCSRSLAAMASSYFLACQACVFPVLSAEGSQLAGLKPLPAGPECPRDCCAVVAFPGGTGHFVTCYKGCCSRLVTLQLTDNTRDNEEAVELALRTSSIINNEYRVS